MPPVVLLNCPCASPPARLPPQLIRNLITAFQFLPAALVYGGVHTAITDLMQRCALAAMQPRSSTDCLVPKVCRRAGAASVDPNLPLLPTAGASAGGMPMASGWEL